MKLMDLVASISVNPDKLTTYALNENHPIRTGWLIRPNDDVAYLTTLYVLQVQDHD